MVNQVPFEKIIVLLKNLGIFLTEAEKIQFNEKLNSASDQNPASLVKIMDEYLKEIKINLSEYEKSNLINNVQKAQSEPVTSPPYNEEATQTTAAPPPPPPPRNKWAIVHEEALKRDEEAKKKAALDAEPKKDIKPEPVATTPAQADETSDGGSNKSSAPRLSPFADPTSINPFQVSLDTEDRDEDEDKR